MPLVRGKLAVAVALGACLLAGPVARAAAITGAAAAVPIAAAGGGPDGGRSARALGQAFAAELEALVERDRIPGAAMALVEGEEVVWEHAVGVRDRSSREPVRTDTTFQVASLSKPVAALGVLLLVEEGRIELDAPVWEYVRSWRPPANGHDPSGVTVRRLLAHRAGVNVHGYPGHPPDRELPTIHASLAGDSAGAGPVELVAGPGTGVRYSSGGYSILQLLVEETTGEPFATFMERRVLRPLGMTRSSFEPPGPSAAGGPGSATGHGWWGGRLPRFRFREQAASGLHSTAGDLARFLRVLHSPQAQAAVGVSASTIATMLAPAEGGTYGLGFALEPAPILPGGGEAPPRVVSHNGANRGYRAMLAAAPEQGFGFVALTNSDRGLATTSDLLCRWGRWVSEVELASCWAERKRRGTLLAVASVLGLGVAMDGAAFVRRERQRRREPRPRWGAAERHGWASWGRLAVSLALLTGWWVFWYTDQLAIRREGIEHFVPASSLPPTFFWLTVVLTAWCLLGVARWLAAVRAGRAGAAS